MKGFGWIALLASFAWVQFVNASVLEGELANPTSIHHLLNPEHIITVEAGIEYSHSAIPDISNVIVENSKTSTALAANQSKVGTVNGNYPDIFAQTLKIQVLLDPASDFTLAAKTFLPLNGLTQLDTGNIYQPEYALYRTEGQRPRVLLTSGIDLNPDFRVGLGLDVGFSVTADADVFLQSGSGTVSDQRVSSKVKPSLLPQASIAYQNYSITARAENKAELDLSTNAGARIFSGVSAGVDFSYTTQSALFYQPWQFEFNGKNKVADDLALKYGLSYELWSGYQAHAAVIQSAVPINCPSGAANCEPQFSSGLTPSFKARNIFIPEVAFDWSLGRDTLEFGYRFKDSIFKGLPTGNGNYLDPPRHDLVLGFTHPTEKGWEWNIHGQVSKLTSQTVVKSDPTDIGGPGYQASGWIYGGGFSVAIPFKN